jgi:LDH2 family malate/lactate/ureidoglycolate dehydrogenase
VRLPGAGRWRARREHAERGISLSPSTAEALRQLASGLRVELPEALAPATADSI